MEEELSELRSNNFSTSSMASKLEEINIATRDAYIYATGIIIVVITVTFLHVWAFYFAQNSGMQMRIITTGAIYHKVTMNI